MNAPSKAMCEIQLGLWQVCRNLDVTIKELHDGTFETAIANLHELWQRFQIEQDKQAEVPERESRKEAV